MGVLRRAIFRLRKRWNPDKAGRELDDEFRFHVDMEARDLMRRGVPPVEARRSAERDFGNRERFREEAMGAGALPRLEGVLVDVRLALRKLRENPGFTAVAVLMLAIAIGADTAIFSVVNDVLLQPLPYEDPHELVVLKEYPTERGVPEPGASWSVSYLNFVDWRDWPGRDEIFEAMAIRASTSFLMRAPHEPLRVRGGLVSANYFDLVGVEAALGRTLLESDGERAVVLGDAIWRSAFAADPEVLGKRVVLDGEAYAVVGVMPSWFDAGSPVMLWALMTPDNHPYLQQRGFRAYGAVARLAEGVTAAQAEERLRSIGDALVDAYPDENENWSVQVLSLHDDDVGPVRGTLALLSAAVGLLLLLACANVANLVLARATGRRQETAVRAALGAGRGRIAQQLVAESVVLSLLAGALGLLLGVWGARVLTALTPFTIPHLEQPALGAAVFAFALGVSIATGVLFGLAPLAQHGIGGLMDPLRRGGHGAYSSGRVARRLRGGLVVAQVALSLVLLVAAGLLMSSFAYLWGFEAGFDADGVLTMEIVPISEKYPEPAHQNALYTELYARLRRVPRVEAVGGITRLPVGSGDIRHTIQGQGSPRDDPSLQVGLRPISGDYFAAMGISVLAGRSLDDADVGAAVVNELLVRELWPGADPGDAVGRAVRFVLRDGFGEWMRVVGVVGATRHAGLDPDPRPELYVSHAERGFGVNVVVMRTLGEPLDVAATVRAVLHGIDAGQPIGDLRTMRQVVSDSMRRPRFYAALFATFGALALAMAATGVFAMAAYSTSRRRREIGIRMAVGAHAGDVVRLVVSDGLVLIGTGVLLGLAASLAAGPYLTGFLYGVAANDPVTLFGATAVLTVAALIGFWLPARRAGRIDPTEALRLE